MRSFYAIVLASVLAVSITFCSCSDIEETSSVSGSSYLAESDSVLTDNVSLSEQNDQTEQNEQSSFSIEDISVDNTIGYVSQAHNLNYLNLYYERISDHEIVTCDGKLKGSFTYTVNENNITFTTTYENLSDENICADFRPSISFVSDKVDNSNPIVTADFDGHTIKPGDSYSFTDDVEIGEYNDVMINYEFKVMIDSQVSVDSWKSEYGDGIDDINILQYVPLGSVFPFIVHLSK